MLAIVSSEAIQMYISPSEIQPRICPTNSGLHQDTFNKLMQYRTLNAVDCLSLLQFCSRVNRLANYWLAIKR